MIEGLKNNLLGLPAITGLELAVRLDATVEDKSIQDQFPSVFKGLGNQGIQADPDKKSAIRDMREPENISELRAW